MTEILHQSIADIAGGVNSKALTVAEVADCYIERTQALKDKLNTHLFFETEEIKKEVKRVEALLETKQKLPLAGVPIGIKDNICVEGQPTTCASKILKGYKPPYSAKVVDKLREAGALIFGKLNLDEFAMGSSNENSAYGSVKNPWNIKRVPGGSSGGSAASVAARMTPGSLGSDTGGSIRQPASMCGVVGLKPSYGRVSRYGLVAFGSSLDQIGPFANRVADTALILDAISGWDERDSTSLQKNQTDFFSNLSDNRKLKIGVVKEFFSDQLDTDVQNAVQAALDVYKSQGCEVVEVSLPNIDYSIAAYYLIATAEASANLARYDGVRYGYQDKDHKNLTELYEQSRSKGFGKEVKQRIMLGTFALSSGYYDAYYGSALKVREMIKRDFSRAFAEVDVLVSPTAPTTAFEIGEKSEDPLSMYLSDIYTIGTNLAGIPGISLPCGFDKKGLPIGLQIMAKMYDEQSLLDAAYMYEQQTKWYDQKKPVI